MIVVHVINGEHFAGAERVQDLLAQELDRLGTQCLFFALKDGEFPKVRRSSSEFVCCAMRNRWDVSPAFKLANTVRERRVDLIHTHTPRALLIGVLASALSGVPLVHHVHSPTLRDTESPLRNRLNAFIENALMRRCKMLIAVAQSLGVYLQSMGIPGSKVKVIHNGTPTRAPVTHGTPSLMTVGMVALFRPRKGAEVLLDALKPIFEEYPNVRLKMIGGFESEAYAEEVRGRCRALGIEDRVSWTGFTPEVNRELTDLSVLAVPSLYGEGLPMVLLEGAAIGLPLVGTRVEGIGEFLVEGTGLTVQPGNADELRKAIQFFLSNAEQGRVMGMAARKRQVERFSVESMGRGVQEVYREVCE